MLSIGASKEVPDPGPKKGGRQETANLHPANHRQENLRQANHPADLNLVSRNLARPPQNPVKRPMLHRVAVVTNLLVHQKALLGKKEDNKKIKLSLPGLNFAPQKIYSMSQSITLYRVSEENFEVMKADPEGTIILDISEENIVFPQTFEGLKFILSKEQDEDTIALLEQIFYPETYISKEIKLDEMEVLSEDLDLDSTAIYYNDREDVADIHAFLDNISLEQFHQLYDAKELNENNVYPHNVWIEEGGPDTAFTRKHLAKEFTDLKNFIAAAKESNDYVLSLVW